jgi:hypothetical protein
MKYFLPITIIFVVAISSVLLSRQHRSSQIPNGSKFDCNNCHTSGGGSSLNSFGLDVLNSYLSSKNSAGNVVWNEGLAALDSDKDGFTNGQELLDPAGAWRPGNPDPGNPNDVGNPGSANSTPSSVIDNYFNMTNKVVSEISVTPNPIFQFANINFSTLYDGDVVIELYTSNGIYIGLLLNIWLPAGNHQFDFAVKDNYGKTLPAGMYLLNIRLEQASVLYKILVNN